MKYTTKNNIEGLMFKNSSTPPSDKALAFRCLGTNVNYGELRELGIEYHKISSEEKKEVRNFFKSMEMYARF